jgi:hypothetical protein
MHVRDHPPVSLEMVFVSQLCVCVTPVGSHANATVMLILYQSGEHPPPLQDTEIGAAPAEGTTTRSGTQTSKSTSG